MLTMDFTHPFYSLFNLHARPNIYLNFKHAKGSYMAELDFLVQDLLKNGIDTTKTILFCR